MVFAVGDVLVHKKSGHAYIILGAERDSEGLIWRYRYRRVDGSLEWSRPQSEMEDGRFILTKPWWSHGEEPTINPPPAPPTYTQPALTAVEQYTLGLLAEEMGEAQRAIGKALRFGLDVGGGETDNEGTSRDKLMKELGDVLAAMNYAMESGLIDHEVVDMHKRYKMKKLKDGLDGFGNKLAP